MKKKTVIFIVLLIIIAGGIWLSYITKDKNVTYEIAQINAYNYFKYNENKKYGIINRQGNVIIEAQYDSIDIPNPEVGIFVCSNTDEEKNIVLNEKNEKILENYDNVETIKIKNLASILCFEKSVLKYEKDGKYGLIDFNGKEITKNIYTSIENLDSTEGKMLVFKDGKYGVINIKGTVLVECEYDKVESDEYYDEDSNYVKSGYIVSNTTDEGMRCGYINYKGKVILDAACNNICRIPDKSEIYLIVQKNGKYGLYKESQAIIECNYQSMEFDDNELLIIQKGRKYGLANLKGEIKIDPEYIAIEKKGIYLYATASDGNVDVYDENANKVDIENNQEVYSTENENYFIITKTEKNIIYYGIKDKSGNILVDETYRYIEYLFDDYFIAKKDEKLGVINSKGEVILELKHDSVQKVKNKNIIQILDSETTYLYSKEIKEIASVKNATLENEENYLKIYNIASDNTAESTELYFDNNGSEISKDSNIVKESEEKIMPNKIGDYVKVQYLLDSVYYTKEINEE